MAGILDLLNSDLGKSLINGVSNQTNQPQGKTQDVLTMGLPLLMAAMKRNASTPQGAEGLMGALGASKHDGSILNNLGGLFEGGVDDTVMNDGDKILGHVLGAKRSNVENTLGARAGIDANSVAQILKVAAPILLGYLGQQKRQKNINNSGGIGDLLGGMLGGMSSGQEQSFLESFLDANGDGSAFDDVAGMLMGGSSSKGGLGGLLGGLFGK